MSRRNVWSGEETMEMLEIIKEKNLMDLFTMNSRTLKPDCDVYKIIEEEMKRNGFPLKDSTQIYHKWKNLKRTFYISRKTNQGTANCEFARELQEILEQQCVTSREVLEQRRKQKDPLLLEEGQPAPTKRRRGPPPKTIRNQILDKLTRMIKEQSEEYAKKWNDLYDYEFKLYKRKEKEQTASLNALLEASKSDVMNRFDSIFSEELSTVPEDGDNGQGLKVETIEPGATTSRGAPRVYQTIKFE
uniref:Myb/SANT-like DNA-binding domain-containing protein n=1 Tax=Anopheles marajoara TaxID=58244 RepID=A0A2M4BXZ8_9DIPT